MKRENFEPPEWYWKYGLHDAEITDIARVEHEYKGNYIKLTLNSSGALYENDIKSITFFNCAAGSDNLTHGWWLGDELTRENGRYLLTIYLEVKRRERVFRIRFERAEVERK